MSATERIKIKEITLFQILRKEKGYERGIYYSGVGSNTEATVSKIPWVAGFAGPTQNEATHELLLRFCFGENLLIGNGPSPTSTGILLSNSDFEEIVGTLRHNNPNTQIEMRVIVAESLQ